MDTSMSPVAVRLLLAVPPESPRGAGGCGVHPIYVLAHAWAMERLRREALVKAWAQEQLARIARSN